MKKCKQCGKTMPEILFRPYYPRGKGLRDSKVGCNTVCLECERINAAITRAWKDRSDEKLLAQAEEYYKMLVANGNHPVGAFAKHVLGEAAPRQGLSGTLSAQLAAGDLTGEFKKLMDLELTEEPDTYQDMLEALRVKTAGGDGRVVAKYRELFEAVATRFDDYEDGYQW